MKASAAVVYNEQVEAVDALKRLYEDQVLSLQTAFDSFCKSPEKAEKVHGFYPKVTIRLTDEQIQVPNGSFGFCDRAGVYETTITQPSLFYWYILRQFKALNDNHDCQFEIQLSDEVIPIHFAFPDGIHLEGQLDAAAQQKFFKVFDSPDLNFTDDSIANSELYWGERATLPLALFRAQRIDYSLHRLQHYTGTAPQAFQKFVHR